MALMPMPRPPMGFQPQPPQMPPMSIEAALQRGAYQPSPSWGGVQMGGGDPVLTAGQLDQDELARGGIERRNAERIQSIDDAAASRGNPMEKGIEAALLRNKYEQLQPIGAQSSIEASMGGSPIQSDVIGQHPMGLPSVGEFRGIEEAERLAQYKSMGNPDEQARGALDSQRLALIQAQAGFEKDIASKPWPDHVKQARIAEARRRLREQVEMLKPGFPPVGGPNADIEAAIAAQQRADALKNGGLGGQ